MGFWVEHEPDDSRDGHWSVLSPFAPDLPPTHWMPLPAPPLPNE